MLYASVSCIERGAAVTDVRREEQAAPTRSEVGEYVHDLAGQLAKLAEAAGLSQTADALLTVRDVVEREF